MDTTQSVVAALREQLALKSYTKITVQDLCTAAFCSRRTFYKHFAGKEAVVQALIHEDYIEPALSMRGLIDLKELKSSARLLSESSFKRIYESRVCYKNLLDHMGKLSLLEMICEANYRFTLSVIKDYDYPFDEMDCAAYLMGAASAWMTARWIEGGFEESNTRLAQLYNTWVMAHWRELGFPQK